MENQAGQTRFYTSQGIDLLERGIYLIEGGNLTQTSVDHGPDRHKIRRGSKTIKTQGHGSTALLFYRSTFILFYRSTVLLFTLLLFYRSTLLPLYRFTFLLL